MGGMCGICEPGFDLPVTLLEPMLRVTLSTGDYPTDTRTGPGVLLGVVRHSHQQQTASSRELYLALDAELHNCPQLALLVDEPAHTSLSIAQILLRLYQKEGLNFVNRLEGSFALALWDAQEQRLILGIDRMGIKALYWRRDESRLLFATRLGAIRVAQGEPLQLNSPAVMQYLIFGAVPAPLTIDSASQKMPSGHLLVFEKGQVRLSCYWDLRYIEEHGRSATSWAEEVRETLRSAVHRHLTDCDPKRTGSFLSGGTDSSTVVAFASEHISPFPTFTIYFSEHTYSEIQFARTVTSRFHARSFEECLLPNSVCDFIPRIVAAYDEPFGNSSVLPTYACAKLARDNGIDVLLAADGGDELFAGNQSYLQDKYFEPYHVVPRWVRSDLLEPLLTLLPDKGPFSLPRRYVRRAALPNPRRFLSYGFFLSTKPETIFQSSFLREVPPDTWLKIAERHFQSAPACNDLNRNLYLDMKMTLADNDLRKVVGTAESLGLRVRFPLLDCHLAELSGRIPASLKLHGLQLRYIFKRAMKGLLPRCVLLKKKHGFGVPVGFWLRDATRLNTLMLDLLGDRNLALRDYFESDFFDWLIKEHAGARDPTFLGQIIWRLMVFELWRRQTVRQEVSGIPALKNRA